MVMPMRAMPNQQGGLRCQILAIAATALLQLISTLNGRIGSGHLWSGVYLGPDGGGRMRYSSFVAPFLGCVSARALFERHTSLPPIRRRPLQPTRCRSVVTTRPSSAAAAPPVSGTTSDSSLWRSSPRHRASERAGEPSVGDRLWTSEQVCPSR